MDNGARNAELAGKYVKLVAKVTRDLLSFQNDRPSTEYQRGYLAALVAMEVEEESIIQIQAHLGRANGLKLRRDTNG